MSKAVMISIRPEWCEKIGSGEKTVEVRKTRPKLPTPFKCYIYCTKRQTPALVNLQNLPETPYLMTTGSFSKKYELWDMDWARLCNGKVIGEFVCDAVYTVDAERSAYLREAFDGVSSDEFLQQARLTAYDLLDYLAAEATSKVEYKVGYGWHITDLVIYGEPKDLRAFHYYEHSGMVRWVSRPPQSWCYVEGEDK